MIVPAYSRNFAHFVRPWRAAFISGVKPKQFLASISSCRQLFNNRHTISDWPKNKNK